MCNFYLDFLIYSNYDGCGFNGNKLLNGISKYFFNLKPQDLNNILSVFVNTMIIKYAIKVNESKIYIFLNNIVICLTKYYNNNNEHEYNKLKNIQKIFVTRKCFNLIIALIYLFKSTNK